MKGGEREGRDFPLTVGSTLIEVLIAIAVVVLVLITIAASGTLVTKNRRFSSDQALATKYSQAALEWVKSMRNTMGWTAFYETVVAKGNPSSTICVNTLPASSAEFAALAVGACQPTDVITGTAYQRSVQFSVISASEIEGTGLVDWTDNNATHQTKTTAVLREWQ
ncbi:TPA: hypothetical protein HA241_05830 [Candidatus Woesearchaeota archaeon]|nr:hypothetical protein [Candidatus Woesearchaeota archaeon]